jgi:hypothetical protein
MIPLIKSVVYVGIVCAFSLVVFNEVALWQVCDFGNVLHQTEFVINCVKISVLYAD